MFRSKIFWFFLVFIWLVACTYWYTCSIKQLCGTNFSGNQVFVSDTVLKPKPVESEVIEKDSAFIALASEEQKFDTLFSPIDLYFPFASSDFIVTPQNGAYIQLVKEYFAIDDRYNLRITGHTDNEDSAEGNMLLSLQRAESVRKKLVQMGLSENRMVVEGKGETEPKASNLTIQGKRLNRRVSLIVK